MEMLPRWQRWNSGIESNLVRCITCFRSGLDAIRASTEHFLGVAVLWKQTIHCTSLPLSGCQVGRETDEQVHRVIIQHVDIKSQTAETLCQPRSFLGTSLAVGAGKK
jgi:hypothetical protein